jgi:NAD(P)-dependent dehydrogenase (short-subunit alcohol dehydrogenase family)
MHVAVLEAVERDLHPALETLRDALDERATAFDGVVKTGRTHLQDATPVRLGQEFGGYRTQVEKGLDRLDDAGDRVAELALGGTAGQANYAAAKAGVIGMTESLAREAGPRNICVNAVCPGVLPTGMTDGITEQRLEEVKAANALGRLNSIEEVAGFIVHLASMRNVSGQLFNLDSRIHRWT